MHDVAAKNPLPLELADCSKASLTNSQGVRYLDFRASLTPHFVKVWTDIALGYGALVLSLIGLFYLEHLRTVPVLYWAAWVVLSFVVGYALAYIHLFLHEAAHYNLASTKEKSDRVAMWCICPLLGSSISKYREVHWNHHRHHGSMIDPEFSYFFPLNFKTFLRVASGLRVLEVLLERSRSEKSKEKAAAREKTTVSISSLLPVAFAAVLQLTVLVSLYLGTQSVMPPLAWVIGVVVVMPLLAVLRPILEHRSEHADPSADYFQVAHGVVNRLFGDGLISSTFGAAGFNRHLLHHWDPQISYTRLAEVETFLMDTEFAEKLQRRQTTYGKAFLQLWGR